MTRSKMNLIMEIIEKDLELKVEGIRGNATIYGLIVALDKYNNDELKRIQTFVKNHKDLFEVSDMVELIKSGTTWGRKMV